MCFSNSSKWIWLNETQQNDSYAEFKSTFTFDKEPLFIRVSADSNYCLNINGRYVSSGQYPDFPHYKVYDEFEITDFCKTGSNELSVTVWYYGIANMSYYPGNAALRFEIFDVSGTVICNSSEDTLSRKLISYQNGRKKHITSQLGLGFAYDITKERELPLFAGSRAVVQEIPLYRRPIERLTVGQRVGSSLIKNEKSYMIFDLAREEVGYLTLKLFSEKKQTLTVSYGEHINDGRVRRLIGNRDFSFEITVGAGENNYTNYFRRLGLRYLEVSFEAPIKVEYLSVLPTVYPLNKAEKHFDSKLHQKIYDTSVRTLELCMHEHYEDCPWREQALYAMDGRNQMLCGYYAFNEFKFPRANLYLMSKDDRPDGLLSICTPTELDLTIPSFSLHYFTEVYEYTIYSKDPSLAMAVFPKLCSVLDVFLDSMRDGLVPRFAGKCHWNFYEWAYNLSGTLGRENDTGITDITLNLLLSIAISNMQKICDAIGESRDYSELIQLLNKNINETFFDAKSGLYFDDTEKQTKSELANALAILSGAVSGKAAEKIAEALVEKTALTPITMSMACFKYDALLKVDRDKYKSYVIKDIEARYKAMLDKGATSFWETEKGEADFDNAGSLCHGWSAMPVYYFNTLLG